MIDFIRFYVLDKDRFDHELSEGAIQLKSTYNIATGEANIYPQSGRYHNMEIKLTEFNSYIRGSLHKMYNSYHEYGNQNYNDFNYCETNEAIALLCSRLNIKPESTKITNLEFGFNIILPYDPQIFIENCLLMYNFEDHTINDKFNGKGDYKEFRKSDYSIKIYNKSKQYGCKEYILRVELKIIKKRVLEKMNIFSLYDLMNKEAFLSLLHFLTERFDKLLIIDSQVMKKVLSTHRNYDLKNYTNPHYWMNLKQSTTPNSYYKKKRLCNDFINTFDLNKSQQEVLALVNEKFIILMNCCRESYSMAA